MLSMVAKHFTVMVKIKNVWLAEILKRPKVAIPGSMPLEVLLVKLLFYSEALIAQNLALKHQFSCEFKHLSALLEMSGPGGQ